MSWNLELIAARAKSHDLEVEWCEPEKESAWLGRFLRVGKQASIHTPMVFFRDGGHCYTVFGQHPLDPKQLIARAGALCDLVGDLLHGAEISDPPQTEPAQAEGAPF